MTGNSQTSWLRRLFILGAVLAVTIGVAASRGAFFGPVAGDAAQKAAFPAVQANAWLMFESGKAKVSPDTVGIPKP